jgi:hypothetical protein
MLPNVRLLALAVVPTALGAQRLASRDATRSDTLPPTPVAGDLVRVRTRAVDARGRGIACDARVTAVAGDTVVLQNVSRWAGCPRQDYPADVVTGMQVARGRRGSRLAHAGAGLLIGGLVGGALLRFGATTDCTGSPCDDEGLTALVTFLGVVAGATVGSAVGAVLPAGPKWMSVPTPAPVRVAGMVLRPAVRIRPAN